MSINSLRLKPSVNDEYQSNSIPLLLAIVDLAIN